MPSYTLEAKPILGARAVSHGDTTLSEVTGLSIVSIASPQGGEANLDKAMKKAFGAGFPKTGQSTLSKDGKTRFLGMGPDLVFAIFEHDFADGDAVMADAMGDAGYYTLQSDNWVALRIDGPKATEALGRICQIDLDPSVFGEGAVVRTVMEHMAATLLREDENRFMSFSAWSSAHSFWHALETSLDYVK